VSTPTSVCRLDELADGEARRFELDGHPIVVVRLGDDVRALGDTCSHDDFSLAEGEVDVDDCTIECWKHGSLFDLNTGTAVTLPATKPVPRFEATVVDGDVCVVGTGGGQ
jgi:3-phenylpropionate/trans-cinnamate dioxygenase ferredoxin subunit